MVNSLLSVYFNSSMVRLKVKYCMISARHLFNFNSSMVRLKVLQEKIQPVLI